jgi:CRISPR-associated exonuclease Cas4
MDPMTIAFAVLGMVFLVALLMWARARQQIRQSGIPDGRVVYQDTDRRHNVERPLVSPSCGLTGKPDYLVEAANGLIPVELKSRNCPRSGPHEGEVAQVTAYCVLVEDAFGATPPCGIIQYADRAWPIRYTINDRKRLLHILDQMREARNTRTAHRDHQHAARCRACGYRAVCDEALD